MAVNPISIAILASSRGTNAQAIINHFQTVSDINVSLVVTNNPNAGVIQVAQDGGVPVEVIPKQEMSSQLLPVLERNEIQFIVLAGFMILVPTDVIQAYPNRIVNIHPALLPKFGGKGMYGKYVHEAVSQSGETETGITIHFVNERYDEGQTIRQFKVPIEPHENPESIARKVQQLEHRYYPKVIEEVVREV